MRQIEEVGGVKLTYMCTTDALQQQPCHLCLAVKLCLGHSQLLFSLKQWKDYHAFRVPEYEVI